MTQASNSVAWLLPLLTQCTALILLAFSLRRAALLIAACFPRPPALARLPSHTPAILILVPCRNEAASLPDLFAKLDRLDYPHDQWRACIVDDGSTDDTVACARTLTISRPWAQLLALPQNVGKSQALNAACGMLAASQRLTPSEIVVVYDADHRPAPDALRTLVAPFADARVAGVSGQMRIGNGRASPAAFYAMLESYVHQLVTMRAKERLNLAPAMLGANCAYRLSALKAAGGFQAGALLEDSDLTLAFALTGWSTRLAEDSISAHHAPVTLRGYIHQHVRWNRGFHQVIGKRLLAVWGNAQLSLLLKLELTFFALGYADRLALLAGMVFTAVDFFRPGVFGFPRFVWLIYFGLPALEMLAALALAREPLTMFLRLIYVPCFFVLDMAIAFWANLETLLRKPFVWIAAERPPLSGDGPHPHS